VATRRTSKKGSKQSREWRYVLLSLIGKHLDPENVAKALGILPDCWSRLGESDCPGGRKAEAGSWIIDGGSTAWRIETQIRHILKKISPAKQQLQKLIREDETIEWAYLSIAVAPPREYPEANYYFDAELMNEFTSLGIGIQVSVKIIERWEAYFS